MPTDPVIGSSFFGRAETIQTLEKRVQAFMDGYRQNMGLVGKASIGKTSLVLQFLSTMKQPGLITIYQKLVAEPFDYFAQKFMGSLLAGYLRSIGEKVPMEFNALVMRTKRRLPKTMKKMRQIMRLMNREDWDTAYWNLLSLTQLIQDDTRQKVLLVLDNFEKLDELMLENPFHAFGNAMMVQKDTLYIVTSGRAEKAHEIFSRKLALLFGNFEVLQLKNFDFETSRLYLEGRFGDLRMSELVRKFLIELTDGHPYYLDAITDRIRHILKEQGTSTVSESVVAHALEQEVFRRKGSLHQHFLISLQALGREKSFYVSFKMLIAIALGQKKIQELAATLRRRLDEVKKVVARLIDEEFVEKRGSFFVIPSPLFSFWLKHVYYPREIDFVGRENLPVEAFHKTVAELFERKAKEEGKEVNKRVEELFRCFDDDVVETESGVLKCPHFQEVHFKPTNGRVFPVEAKAAGIRWLCQVAHKKVSEDDVRGFIHDIAALKSKVQQKIMIALHGTELNATLLAKEAKINVWSLKDLNALLGLYGRHKVIH